MMNKSQKRYGKAMYVFFFSVLFLFILMSFAYAQTLQLLSPNGGESWSIGQNKSITWTFSGLPANHAIQLELLHNGSIIGTIRTNISIGVPGETSSWTWRAGTYQGGTAAADSGYAIRITDMWNRQYTDVSNGTFTLVRGIGPGPSVNRPDNNLTAKPHVTNTIFTLPDLVISDAWIEDSDIRWLVWKVENKNWRRVKLDPDNPFNIQICALGIRCDVLRVSRVHIEGLNRSGYSTIRFGWDHNCDVRFIVDYAEDVEEFNESNNRSTFMLTQ
jgi:hypothetical protein